MEAFIIILLSKRSRRKYVYAGHPSIKVELPYDGIWDLKDVIQAYADYPGITNARGGKLVLRIEWLEGLERTPDLDYKDFVVE